MHSRPNIVRIMKSQFHNFFLIIKFGVIYFILSRYINSNKLQFSNIIRIRIVVCVVVCIYLYITVFVIC
jgi:hypothetical protein